MVDVESVTSNVPRSNFEEADLEILADMILESGGILKPLVLKKIGFEQYEVVDGHFEYYSAVRAKEKNSSEGDMIGALIISSEQEDIVLRQVATLKGVEFPSSEKPLKQTSETQNLELRMTNMELRFEKQLNDLKSELTQERQKIDDKFKQFERLIPQKINPLSLLNTLQKDELFIRLQRSRISGSEKIAKAIIEARNKKSKQAFEDYRDVQISVKGLGEKTLLTIIDEWCRN
jgi:hypothetical protein